MKRTLNRLLSLVLVVALFISAVPTQAFAAEQGEVYLPQIAIGDDILDHDVFYLASASASIEENSKLVYLLKVGRGGPADSESTALIKIADMTAKYGEDYIVRVHDEKTKVDDPEDNFSLMEMIEDSDFTQTPISDSDEFADMMENDPDAQQAYQEGVEAALEYLEEASGISDKYGDENPYADAVGELYGTDGEDAAEPAVTDKSAETAEPTATEKPTEDEKSAEGDGNSVYSTQPDTETVPVSTDGAADAESAEPTESTEPVEDTGGLKADIEAVPVENDDDLYDGAIPADNSGEVITIGGDDSMDYDPVQAAANLFTGQNATAQRLTSEGDMFQDLQAIANVMTNAVVGASVELTFAEGETEKYLEIVPKDNHKGDGDRMFYIILGAPSGTTTNSAASSCAFTIVDDEEQEPATVSFSDAVYNADEESVTITVERSGAMNTVVSARVKTTGEGTAQAGRDYSEVDSELVFPFGVDHLSLEIPVRTEYLSGAGDFELALEPTAGCETGDIDAATVTIDGSYTTKANLRSAQSARLMSAGGAQLMAASSDDKAKTRNTLGTYRTLSPVKLDDSANVIGSYVDIGERDAQGTFSGVNQYSDGAWQLQYKGSGNLGGLVGARFPLTKDYWESYFLAGAEVSVRSDSTDTRMALAGPISDDTDMRVFYDLGYHGFLELNHSRYHTKNSRIGSYNAFSGWINTSDTTAWKTYYVYPNAIAVNPASQPLVSWEWLYGGRTYYKTHPAVAGDHPSAIAFVNSAGSGGGGTLKISSVKPILRPFEVTVLSSPTNSLEYLKEDGTRDIVTTATTTDAELVEAGASGVFFEGDSFTVQTIAGTGVSQYAYISGLELMDGADPDKVLYKLAGNEDSSVNRITYTLNTDNMAALIKAICPDYKHNETQNWYNLLRQNTIVNDGQNKNGYATYVKFNVRPELGYVDSTVTLRNPYTFPVTFTISGTDYTVAAGETKEIKAAGNQSFHKGDVLAISKITLGAASSGEYTPAGVRYSLKYQSTSAKYDQQGTWDFMDNGTIYVGGEDHRLNYGEIVIEPNLQKKDNQIVVRVKTSDLSKFDTTSATAGVLKQQGTVEGAYTYFTFAGPDQTANGRMYPITVTPKSGAMVCVWEDKVAQRTYEGNTLYFTAGVDADRNVITLSVQPAAHTVTLEGNLYYTNYNLRTGYEGNESSVPAQGATLAAGSAGGVADQNGHVTAGPIPYTGLSNHYLRYLVSVNGSDMVKELLLPKLGAVTTDDGIVPNMLWDFNEDAANSAPLGEHLKNQVEYQGGSDSDGSEYYTFTATGDDPYVSVDVGLGAKINVSWAKIRARNLSGADSMAMSIYHGIFGTYDATATIGLEKDADWHEYVVYLTDATPVTGDGRHWTWWEQMMNPPPWFRLDPMEGNAKSGSQIQIDYIAFFGSEADARKFRSDDPDLLWDFNTAAGDAGESYDFTAAAAAELLDFKDDLAVEPAMLYDFTYVESDSGSDGPEGSTEPVPNMLWDFNADAADSTPLGEHVKNKVEYAGGSDSDGSEYYTFTATGDDPYVSVDVGLGAKINVSWAKIRARNLSEADSMAMSIYSKNSGSYGATATIGLQKDADWHEYVVYLTGATPLNGAGRHWTWWESNTSGYLWFRLDPMEGNAKNGSQIQIDYIAFFGSEDDAKAFTNSKSDDSGRSDDSEPVDTVAEHIGAHSKGRYISYEAGKDSDGTEYYTFTVTAANYGVSLDKTADSVDDVQWVRMRVRNKTNVKELGLFGATGNYTYSPANTRLGVALAQDTEWHEYIFNIYEANKATMNLSQSAWSGKVNWVRLDPGVSTGDKLDVDYIAFFPNEVSARAYGGGEAADTVAARMGSQEKADVSYASGKDSDGTEYYTFTATGSDPRISLDITANSVDDIQWVRMRVRNQSGAKKLELFGATGGNSGVTDASNLQIDLEQDTEWHEYIFNIYETNKATKNLSQSAWSGKVNWVRLDPGVSTGDKLDIDYIAFYPGVDSEKGGSMDAYMGAHAKANVTYTAETDSAGNNYYTFTATGSDPRVSIDLSADSVDDIQWVKLRARKLSGNADKMELFACTGSNTNVRGNTCAQIPLAQDTEWHEYLVNIPQANMATQNSSATTWTGSINWIRLDPMEAKSGSSIQAGDRIQIDYVAFFAAKEKAMAYRNSGAAVIDLSNGDDDTTDIGDLPNDTLDISSNFPKGVSPVTSPIFSDIQITGRFADNSYQILNGASIPIVLGKTVNLSVAVKSKDYSFSMTGNDGKLIEDNETENAVSVQLVVYDQNDRYKGVYDKVDQTSATYNARTRTYTFNSTIEFIEAEEETTEEVPVGLVPNPGDRLYLRLVTDRLAQAEGIRTSDDTLEIYDYQYSDIYTGMDFYQPVAYEPPPTMGITDPIEIDYGSLPFISDTGMNINFPFVNVGIMRINQGYRIYIGFSPMQIVDTVKGSHITKMSGSDGQYWKDLFSMAHPFDTMAGGIGEAQQQISEFQASAKEAAENGTEYSTAGMGSPSWKFDLSVGMYFDFMYATVQQGTQTKTIYKFNGMGGYLSITLGFSMAWYVVLPVVFLPAYFGIEIEGTVIGFLGADFNSKIITYDDALSGVDVTSGVSSLNGGIRGLASVQLSLGVGLCGTLGVRVAGKVSFIANWEPTDPHGEWGFYTALSAGLIIDLFLFSIPLVFTWADWPMGSFEYYANRETQTLQTASLSSAGSTFQLREGSGEDSMWLGDQMLVMGAFRPNKTKEKILAADAYERSDAQLITLKDGKTLALAFIDSDTAKGAAQRTTLKLSIYNADSGLWSEPVVVSNDSTADFQPSIAETKDGRLLVAWVSPTDTTITDFSSDDQVMKYLNSMEVYAAFIELENGQIKTKTDNGITVADTEITQITNDHYTRTVDNVSTTSSYYDSNPTVVCDMESGDAMVYYIKSGRSSLGDGQITDYINPYTNDCVVCYMPYNAAADTDTDNRTVPAGWLFNNFYYSELHGDTANEQSLIDNFGGQRFLDGALNENNERYTIPDFAAVAYNGLAIYAYTVDTDGSNDTDVDKELYLQVYDFRTHETKYRLSLTDDKVADAMPQFFRSKVNTAASGGASTGDESTHTKLFWYRDGKEVVYIDVTALLSEGIDANGNVTDSSIIEPRIVYTASGDGDSNASLQSADFKAVEDNKGNLYILWTEGVTDKDGNTAQEIFGTGLISYEVTDPEGKETTGKVDVTSGWSKPYQITSSGYNNDEMAVAMSGENLIVVHNRFKEELIVDENDVHKVDTVASYMPIQITEMKLVSETMEPCGSVEAEEIKLAYRETTTITDSGNNETTTANLDTPVTLPKGGEKVAITVAVSNNGMNIAEGYKLTLYAVDKSGAETKIGEIESTDSLVPNRGTTHTFEYTLPADVDGLTFKAVTQEMNDASNKSYYRDTDTYTADPLTAEAVYEITGTETYQDEDGFHAKFTVKNTGNAASSAGDTLNIQLWGPANLANLYPDEKGSLHSEKISLGIGQTKEFDVPVSITPEMIKEYGFVTTRVAVQKEVVEQVLNGQEYKGTQFLSNLEYVYFDLVQPMNMELANVSVAANSTADISFSMDLGDTFQGGDRVTYALEDNSIARLQDGKVLGVSAGTTTLYATHAATGATVASTVTVTNSSTPSRPTPTPTEITVEVSSDEGAVSVTASVSGDTATITAPTEEQMEEITGKGKETGAVTIDLSSLPENVTAVAIPAETVKAIDEAMEDTGDGLAIKLPNATVTFAPEALESIAEQTTGPDLKLNVEPITESKLNAKQREALTDLDVQAVYDVYLTSGGKRISDFGGGKASVEVTHTVKDGQKPGGVAVWYVAEAGGKTRIPTTTSEKAVRFTVSHFSDYVLTYDETLPGACEKDDTCPMTGFTDLDKSKWYHDGVHWALEEGVMSGYGGGRFGPNDTTTRAQIVQMLWNLEGKPKTSHTLTFKDVASDKWYTGAIRWASEKKLVSGYSSEKFGPDDKLTREQLATILNRYAKYKGMDTSAGEKNKLSGFTDAQQISSWAEPSFRWAVDAGIIAGVGGGRLSPKTDATRAQVATMLMRYDAIEQ